MSVVRKTPFIEQFLGKLTADQLTSLLSTINSDDTPIRYSLVDKNLFIPAYTEDAIGPVTLELEKGKAPYNGFLIHVTNTESNVVCLFVGHHRFQDLMLVSIDVTHRNFTKIHEDCDINELRRVLADKMDESGATSDLTPAKLESILKGSESIVVDRSEDGEHTVVSIDEDVLDFILPKEVPLAKIVHEPSTANTIITVEPGVLSDEHGYFVTLEVEGEGSHFGASFTVFPYNDSQCLTAFHMLVDNDVKECFAHLGSDGSLVIDIPTVMTPESQDTIIHFKRII